MWEGIRMIKKGKHDKRFEQKNGMLMVHSDCFFFFSFDVFYGLLLLVSVIAIVVCFC